MKQRLWIKHSDIKYLITFLLISTAITSTAGYLSLYPIENKVSMAMAVLDSNGLALHYFPNNSPNVRPGEQINWTLSVYNQMGTITYAVIRVKLLNASLSGPNDTTLTPSPVQSILEFRHILLNNETWSTNFAWRIDNLTAAGNSVNISNLTINGISYFGTLASALGGRNFRFVFELWLLNPTTNQLVFSGYSQDAPNPVWDQVWYNAMEV
ncbi:MAG: hypothetical protein ACHQ03_09105 [Candidatus Bathyarchaeia archaeon]